MDEAIRPRLDPATVEWLAAHFDTFGEGGRSVALELRASLCASDLAPPHTTDISELGRRLLEAGRSVAQPGEVKFDELKIHELLNYLDFFRASHRTVLRTLDAMLEGPPALIRQQVSDLRASMRQVPGG